ncbi:MAG: 1-(5-phosphoribosyl)-5-[(5-phosphoribosylamino)methylideneamino]imidazole-4-carboxamide isomerase [Christensenellaceae bacterium]
MILFPAIDILEGRAVRLKKGLLTEVTDFGAPVECAKRWVDAGAQWLHVVDLGGAFDGISQINDTIYEISKLGVPIQSGGGLRTMEDVANRLAAGASRVVIGTLAYTDYPLFKKLVEKYGNRIVAGIDANEGMVSVCGWTQQVDMTAVTFAKRMKQTGVLYAVYTDISRDGLMAGVAVDSTKELAEESGLQVIASGGVSSVDDLLRLKEAGIYGAILGRSIYNGAIDLKEAIRVTKNAL